MIPQFPWQQIEAVFLDMDGVLLDLHFDNWFWREFVPRRYARVHGTNFEKAQKKLLAAYKNVESTLNWYDLAYWSQQLQLDIYAMKEEAREHIALLPGAIDFLDAMRKIDIPVFLVTNAHPQTLAVKLGKYDLTPWLTDIASSSTVGAAKEDPRFWEMLTTHIPYHREATFFADDTEKVLLSARQSGPQYLLHIAQPSSAEDAVFSQKLPSTARLSDTLTQLPGLQHRN